MGVWTHPSIIVNPVAAASSPSGRCQSVQQSAPFLRSQCLLGAPSSAAAQRRGRVPFHRAAASPLASRFHPSSSHTPTANGFLHLAAAAVPRGEGGAGAGAGAGAGEEEVLFLEVEDRKAANQLRTAAHLVPEVVGGVAASPRFPGDVSRSISSKNGFGGKDRRLYRELIWTATRYWPWVQRAGGADPRLFALAPLYLAPPIPEVAALRAGCADAMSAAGLAGGAGAAVAPAEAAAALGAAAGVEMCVRDLFPRWLEAECGEEMAAGPALETLLQRAPVWLRLQAPSPQAAAAALKELEAAGLEPLPSDSDDVLPGAIRLGAPGAGDATATKAFLDGHLEVQDLGSQMILAAVGSFEGESWLDACAGAGGKSLQLAGLVGRGGHVDAVDPRKQALAELSKRAKRAGIRNLDALGESGAGWRYDGVLVDAPCSGCGTWRRAPHLKWQTSEKDLEEMSELQGSILASQATRVRRGGRLVYATCSLAKRENSGVVAAFLAANPDFNPEPLEIEMDVDGLGRTLLPGDFDSDGYYVACMRRALED